MIQTIALTILMPATVILPTAPARLPGPSLPVSIDQTVRLPSPTLPVAIGAVKLDDLRLPAPLIPAPAQKAPSAIDTLKRIVGDDRPLPLRKAFDNARF